MSTTTPTTSTGFLARWRRKTPSPIPHPAAPVLLLAAHEACHACGQAVPAAVDTFTMAVPVLADRPTPPPEGRTGVPRPAALVEMAECETCAARDDEAAALLDPLDLDTPGVRARVSTALAALAALGQSAPAIHDRAALQVLLAHMAPKDDHLAWSWADRFDRPGHPATVEDLGACSPHPWAHVDEDTRAELRSRYGALLAARRTEGGAPVPIPPPPLSDDETARATPITGGCMMCGMGAVMVPAAWASVARGDLWTPLRAGTAALGGSGSPHGIAGHTCPPCSKALAEVGSVGLTACERSMRRHLTATGDDEAASTVREGETSGLIAWGALVHQQRARGAHEVRPNDVPWEHIRLATGDEEEEE